MSDVDLVIIGAGPAGLAAAHRVSGSPYRVALIDGGKTIGERDRHEAVDMTRGHGGAGLFSDGKFSFFPSASELWKLSRSQDLRAAYNWTCALLGSYGLDTPPFPDEPEAFAVGNGEWVLKDYPSDYLSLESRLRLTADMVAAADVSILTETEVCKVEHDLDADLFTLELRTPQGRTSQFTARRLLIGSGRFGPLGMHNLVRERTFRRLEVGFRIEQQAGDAFFKDMRQLDPKLRFRAHDDSVEWRTFCACRDGEAALTETQGLWTVSGRSDCPATGRSNVGFNTRILDEEVAQRAMAPALAAMSKEESYFEVPLDEVLRDGSQETATLDRVYGPELRKIMMTGLAKLIEAYPTIHGNGAQLIGPTLEGIGWYPRVDSDLRVPGLPAWVAGDACGLFRGIVAAMISGHYAADSALRDLAPL